MHPSTVVSCRAAAMLLNMHGKGTNVQVCSCKKHFRDTEIKVPSSRVTRTVAQIPQGPKLLGFKGEIGNTIFLMDLSLYLLISWYQTQNFAFQKIQDSYQ